MKCDICKKEKFWLIFIGKDNVCNSCIARKTVFKEVADSNETMLRKAMRAFSVKCFTDLAKITNAQVDDLAMGVIKCRNDAPTVKFKKNRSSAVVVDKEEMIDPMTEQDEMW